MMRRFISLIFILVIIQVNTQAQSCLSDGISFSTQSQIDNFQLNNPGCIEIEGDVAISGNDILNLHGLSVLTSIGGDLSIDDNPLLIDLTGLNNVTSISGHLNIGYPMSTGNLLLTSMSGLENLANIGGDLYIASNFALTSMSGLESLNFIGRHLEFYSNPALHSLEGLEGLTSIGGSLIIMSNGGLISLTGLENLASIGEAIEIVNNDSLISLMALTELTKINKSLEIVGNASLTSLSGLENLTSIGGSLTIGTYDWGGNPLLTSLSELSALTSIDGYLMIVHNDALDNLSGLENINSNSIISLYITDNIALTTCEVKSICQYLSAISGLNIIYNNAPDCNSPEEVITACTFGLDDNATTSNRVNIYPNPSSTTITIELPRISAIKNTTLAIYNVNAQQVISLSISEPISVLDIGTLPGGVYIVKIIDDRKVEVGKFVKQ